MKKQFITGFVCGALIFGAAGAFAGQYVATDNPFPIKLNGNDVSIEGYNINDYTYFKLRDIADAVGSFNVDFQNSTIQLSKDGYVYDNSKKLELTDEMKDYFTEYGYRIPNFDSSDINNNDFVTKFISMYYTGVINSKYSYSDGYIKWDEDVIRNQYKLLFGIDMPECYGDGLGVRYNNGIYEVSAANDYAEYEFSDCIETDTGLRLVYNLRALDNVGTLYGHAYFNLSPADNENGYIITSKTTDTI